MASTTLAFSSSSSLFAKSSLPQKQNPLSFSLNKPKCSFLSPSLPLSSLSLSRLSLSETPERPTFTAQARRSSSYPEETIKLLRAISPEPLEDVIKRLQRKLNKPVKKVPVPEEIFAVVMIGSRQYIVIPGRWIYAPRLKGANVNDKIVLNKVLLVGTRDSTYVGKPVVTNAAVHAVVEEQLLDDKVIVFKYKKKKNYRRNIGHRQPITRLKITGITGYEDYPASTLEPQMEPQTVA